jgi:DNA invertase Pin-like site-specific DNA recombinase
MKTAIVYTRVSSDDQIKGTSLATQLAEIKAYCSRHEIEIIEHYEDAGESAKTADRPGLIKALDACKKKKADFLVVHRLDRLSRNATDGLAIRARLAANKTELLSVSEPLSTEPAGQFMSTIMFAAAQFDNDVRSARSRSGMSATAVKGGWTYHAPYGFKVSRREDGLPILSISLPDASRLKSLLKAYAQGKSTLTATIHGFKAMGFDRGKANRIFHEPIYGGIIRSKLSTDDIIAAFDGYITPEEWYRLEARYAEDKRSPRRDKPSEKGFYLSVCTCTICGSRLKGSFSRSKNKRLYGYYRCPKGHVNLRAEALEAAVEDALAELAGVSVQLRSAIGLAVDYLRKTGHDFQKVEHHRQQEIRTYKTKLSKIAESLIDGDIDKPVYQSLRAKYLGKIAELEQKDIETDNSQIYFERAVFLVDSFKNIRGLWKNMLLEDRKALLLTLKRPLAYNPESEKVEHLFDQAGIARIDFSKPNVQMAPLA